MTDVLDLLYCQQCGTYFVPEPEQGTEVKVCKGCQDVVRPLLTDVVDPLLTGSILDIKA